MFALESLRQDIRIMLETLQRTIATEIHYHEEVKGHTHFIQQGKRDHVVFNSPIMHSLVPLGLGMR